METRNKIRHVKSLRESNEGIIWTPRNAKSRNQTISHTNATLSSQEPSLSIPKSFFSMRHDSYCAHNNFHPTGVVFGRLNPKSPLTLPNNPLRIRIQLLSILPP